MTNINITVGNHYLPNIYENFYYPTVDLADLEEVEYCAEECCGIYLDMHTDAFHALCPDLTDEEIAEACFYTIEEVVNYGI